MRSERCGTGSEFPGLKSETWGTRSLWVSKCKDAGSSTGLRSAREDRLHLIAAKQEGSR
jgi:hypothetical protein